MAVASAVSVPVPVLGRLGDVCEERGLPALAERLRGLGQTLGEDLAALETLLAELPRGAGPVERSAFHLIDLGGKRLRPLCVALAARVGAGFGPPARELAVAVELVHTATLLHDDVVDLGDVRRNVPAARTVYGNAASIFAGDWLLVEALRRVRAAAVPGTLDRLLAVIDEMIQAESLQLAQRGRVATSRAEWLRVVEGKTAALFRWAMWAGARAGRLPDAACDALERYGKHLGVAFQVVDDLLDLSGVEAETGKHLGADLREGKMTYPVILALEREPELAPALVALAEAGNADAAALAEVRAALARTGAVAEARALAEARARAAVACLDGLPAGKARLDLVTIAQASVEREA